MSNRPNTLPQRAVTRYLLAFGTVVFALVLRLMLTPLTGTGAPFVLFFGAALVTSLYAGVGPGIAVLTVSLPIASYMFVMRAGYSFTQTASQALLYAFDGVLVLILTHRMSTAKCALESANQELRRVNDQLRDSEERFRLIVDEAPIGKAIVGLDGRFVRVNRAFCNIVGYDAAELTRRTFQSITHPDDLDADMALAKQLARGEIPSYKLAKRYIRKDGSIVEIMLHGSVLRDKDGSPLNYIAQIEDVTQQNRAEEALKLSEAKFSGMIGVSADAIIAIDQHQRIIIFNDGAERTFGYSKTEAVGAPLDMLIPERFRTIHREHVEKFAAGPLAARRMGERVTTIAGLRKNGEEFPADATISKLQVDGTRILTVSLRDISAIKRVEREERFLAEASAALSTSLDYEQTLANLAQLAARDFADVCIVEIADEHARLRRLKVASTDPSKQPLCEQLERVQVERDRPYLLRAALETRRPVLLERITPEYLASVAQGPEHLQILRGIGAVSMIVVPLLSHERLLGGIAFISSAPNRIYDGKDLRVAELLASRAAMAIENARLFRASVHATQLRDRVLGVVAHDLRNPLSTVVMQAAALQHSDPAGEPQRASRIIQRAATRMNRLIQDLLDVARMEEGEMSLVRAPLATRALVDEAVEMQRPLAASSSVELRLDLPETTPNVLGDHDRLLQVFENLIGNAIKFTGAGGRITVGAAPRQRETVFWVADTGRGITPEHLTHVFDRFWQATRADRLGAGLGLPITKGIVEAHGGRIWVDSTLGLGTTFYFTIPGAPTRETRSEATH